MSVLAVLQNIICGIVPGFCKSGHIYIQHLDWMQRNGSDAFVIFPSVLLVPCKGQKNHSNYKIARVLHHHEYQPNERG